MNEYQHASGNLDIDGLADLIKDMLSRAWGDSWGQFMEEEPTDSNPEKVPACSITYEISSRVPSERARMPKKLRPGAWEVFPDPDNEGETIRLSRQWFDIILEFKCWAPSIREAKTLARKFEDFMFTYTGYFKEQGIAELLFVEEVRPEVDEEYRIPIPFRLLRYYVLTEHIIEVRSKTLKNIHMDVFVDKADQVAEMDTYPGDFDLHPLGRSQSQVIRDYISNKGGNV